MKIGCGCRPPGVVRMRDIDRTSLLLGYPPPQFKTELEWNRKTPAECRGSRGRDDRRWAFGVEQSLNSPGITQKCPWEVLDFART